MALRRARIEARSSLRRFNDALSNFLEFVTYLADNVAESSAWADLSCGTSARIALICAAIASRVARASCIESSRLDKRMRAVYEDVGKDGLGLGGG